MKAKRTGNRVVARFDRGDTYPETFIALANEHSLGSASITGIGAVENTILAYYDLERKEYIRIPVEGIVELVKFSGNLTILDNQRIWHIHAIVGDREGNLRGGHLVSCRVAITIECVIDPIDFPVCRNRDESTGLNLIIL